MSKRFDIENVGNGYVATTLDGKTVLAHGYDRTKVEHKASKAWVPNMPGYENTPESKLAQVTSEEHRTE